MENEMKTKRAGAAVFVVIGALASGCGGATPDAPKIPAGGGEATAASSTTEQQSSVGKAAELNEGGGLSFSADVLRLCPGVKPPHFGFDSAQLRGEWVDALRTLADCMKTGGLKDKGLVLTGHTDPRGEEAYNIALGTRRADAVKSAIVSFAVDPNRLGATSRGKTDAKGTDEGSWALDRRVDVALR
jgi:peptidoglycan-associated lipoprotein